MAAAGGHWLKIAQGDIGKLVFVPRGQTPAQAITGARPAARPFPDSVNDVHVIKGLGGSTGAKMVQDDAGNLYVMKKGANADHIREESAADNAYRAMGVDVPEHRIYDTPGGPVKIARFVEGKTLDNLDSAGVAKVTADLRKNFTADALLGNWDVIGLSRDNVMLGANGKTYRIDNGGALRYRAQGSQKSNWGGNPTEIFSMRTSPQGKSVFGSVTFKEIVNQASAMSGKRAAVLAVLPQGVRGLVSKRFDALDWMIKTYNTMSKQGASDSAIEAHVKSAWGV